MDNKDFFDEELDKIEQEKASTDSQPNGQFDNWSGYHQPPQQAATDRRKPWYIVLICVALVLCIVLGWVLCAVFSNFKRTTGDQLALFDEVLKYLEQEYYQEIPDEKMWAAMEAAGTAMMQNAGDQFSRLLSPASYYEYIHPQSSLDANEHGSFGISYQLVEGIGLYVYEVATDSSAYGKLQGDDLVYKLTDIATINGNSMDEIVTNAVSSEQFTELLKNIQSATFHVLRNGDAIEPVSISRGFTDYVNANYKFEFIEFYFGDNLTNISTQNMGTAGTNTKEVRKLAELSKLKNTGYIRIKEFSYVEVEDKNNPINTNMQTVVDEFKIAMDLFRKEIKNGNVVVKEPCKYLILDLKGNPGGVVDFVTEIAGMLATDSKLTAAERKTVKKGLTKNYIMTTLTDRNGKDRDYTAELGYEAYFGAAGEKPSIVVWTDKGSASASELLTGALLDYKTAVHMGTRTYGKGIAQYCQPLKNYTGTFKLPDGTYQTSTWAIYYTSAQYFSPVTHTNIHGKGYVPKDYNNLTTYAQLWNATINYFNSASGGGILATNG